MYLGETFLSIQCMSSGEVEAEGHIDISINSGPGARALKACRHVPVLEDGTDADKTKYGQLGRMNPKKKPRTSLYSDQLTRHWSSCGAGFEGLPSWNSSTSKESYKKGFKTEDGSEEEEKEVDIMWSSSSEDEDKVVKDIRTLDRLLVSNKRSVTSGPAGRSAGRRQERKISTLTGKLAMSWREGKDTQDTSLEDSIISDSGSDADERESFRILGAKSQKDGPLPRTDIGTAVVKRECAKEKESTPTAATKRTYKTGMASQFVARGKKRYVQSKQDSFELEILDYDSPSEEGESSAVSEAISDPSSASQSSWTRGQASTSITSPRPNPMGSPRTGSEWVKKLKASITPERRLAAVAPGEEARGAGSVSTGAAGGTGNVDSARKRKKFVSCGLADRLQRLVSREKSSIAMWYHNQADSQNSQQEGSKSGMVVKVLSCEAHRGLYMTRCVTQVSGGSKVTSAGDQAGCSSQSDEMYVLFTRSTGDQLGLNNGMLITIHTPWQKLSIPNVSKPVVLCTYFCRPLNPDLTDIVQGQPILPEWPTEDSKSTKVLNPVRLFPGCSSRSPGAEVVTNLENKMKNISASIMHSVSESGACSSSGISFKATVQRIVTRRLQTVVPHQSARMTSSRNPLQTQASPSLIKSLLLQDREGVVCEVQLTNQMAASTTWQQVLQSGEGASYIFMNLRVTQRLTLARAPGLSSMIRSLQHCPDQMNGQTVCYVLTSELGVTAVECLDRSDSKDIPLHRPPCVMDLCDVVKNSHRTPTRRASFSATPLLISPTSPDDVIPSSGPRDTPNASGSWLLFLSTATSLHHPTPSTSKEGSTSQSHRSDRGEYVCLHVHPSNALGEDVLRSNGNRTRIFCRDILATSTQDGVFLNADGFSDISIEEESVGERIPDLRLSVLKVDTRLHSLVNVTGNICGVEEESAYSWPACPQCGNNHLDGGEGSGFVLHCSVCNRDISSPLVRMHLVVQLTCPTLPSTHTVKVQLLQTTIESVLPSQSSQASGGHDLQGILGVLIGPINCLVRTVSETPEREMFLLEEVSLCK